MKCNKCGCETENNNLKKKKYICPHCNAYMRIPAYERISMVSDKGTFEEWFSNYETNNVLDIEGYDEKIKKVQDDTGLKEAVVVGMAYVYDEPYCIGVCDTSFLMGSMGWAVGEKLTSTIERATDRNLPIVIFCASGGARMQEGIVSLMQMAKVSSALAKHSEKGLFYCSVLTDPTTGGVTASFGMLGDIILAEPGALIGFAGQRVIKQTIGEELPEGFQTAEFQEEHGFIDGIVERKRLKKVLGFLILVNKKSDSCSNFQKAKKYQLSKDYRGKIKSFLLPEKNAWDKVKAIRRADHPSTMDFVDGIFDMFIELKGDRLWGDDKAIVGGIALLEGQPVTVIFQYRGKTMDESLQRNFGMPNPEGYRKALRLMKQAEKFNRPIITFINTPGAYCGVEAEKRGQGEAIARNLFEMSRFTVPILAIIVGEAGSGGALALAVANEVWMLENATYSILTPEGYASILWKDSSRAEEAAEKMKIVASDLMKLHVIDGIIPEHGDVTIENVPEISEEIKKNIINFLNRMSNKTKEEIVNQRYERFRKL